MKTGWECLFDLSVGPLALYQRQRANFALIRKRELYKTKLFCFD
jgi:hypothetical protein